MRKHGGGQDRIRTYVRLRGQIYSLLPLTTRPPVQMSSYRTAVSGNRGSMTKGGGAVNALRRKIAQKKGCFQSPDRLGNRNGTEEPIYQENRRRFEILGAACGGSRARQSQIVM